MNSIRNLYERYFFTPTSPTLLGLYRVMFYGGLLFLYTWIVPKDFVGYLQLPDSFWMPIELFSIAPRPALSVGVMVALTKIWYASLFLSMLGLLTRLSTYTAFLTSLFLFGYTYCFGKVGRSDAILIFVMGIFAVSRCQDAFSVDAAWKQPSSPPPVSSGEYTWPIRLIRILLVLLYFGAGLSKAQHSGISWIHPHNLAVILVGPTYAGPETPWLNGIAVYLAQFPIVTSFMAVYVMAFEIAAPLALLGIRLRMIIIPALAILQVLIWLFLGIGFFEHFLCYGFWLPLDRAVPVGLTTVSDDSGFEPFFDEIAGQQPDSPA